MALSDNFRLYTCRFGSEGPRCMPKSSDRLLGGPLPDCDLEGPELLEILDRSLKALTAGFLVPT